MRDHIRQSMLKAGRRQPLRITPPLRNTIKLTIPFSPYSGSLTFSPQLRSDTARSACPQLSTTAI